MSFCTKCGTKLEENQKFCCICGKPVYTAPKQEDPAQTLSDTPAEDTVKEQTMPEGAAADNDTEVVEAEIVHSPESVYSNTEPEYSPEQNYAQGADYTYTEPSTSDYMDPQEAKNQKKKCIWMSIVCFAISIVGIIASMSNPVFVVYNVALLLCTVGLIFGIISFKKGGLLGLSIPGVIINSLSMLICSTVILMTVL